MLDIIMQIGIVVTNELFHETAGKAPCIQGRGSIGRLAGFHDGWSREGFGDMTVSPSFEVLMNGGIGKPARAARLVSHGRLQMWSLKSTPDNPIVARRAQVVKVGIAAEPHSGRNSLTSVRVWKTGPFEAYPNRRHDSPSRKKILCLGSSSQL